MISKFACETYHANDAKRLLESPHWRRREQQRQRRRQDEQSLRESRERNSSRTRVFQESIDRTYEPFSSRQNKRRRSSAPRQRRIYGTKLRLRPLVSLSWTRASRVRCILMRTMRAKARATTTRATRIATRTTTTTTTTNKKRFLGSGTREANCTHVSQLIIEHLLVAYHRNINYDLRSPRVSYRFKTSLYNSRLQGKQINWLLAWLSKTNCQRIRVRNRVYKVTKNILR